MNATVPLALFGFPIAVLVLFWKLPRHRAVIAAFLLGWLFLPVVNDPVLGLRWTKPRAVCWSILAVAILVDCKSFLSARPRLGDVPMALWSLAPFLSSLSNDLGPYDAVSQTVDQFVTWGIPYLLGRVYLRNVEQVHDLALGVVWSGLVYVPLCLLEIRVSPQLHTWVYGYFPHASFAQSIRYGGFRPSVFLEHGLAVSAWLCTATLTSFWLWYSQAVKTHHWMVFRVPSGFAAGTISLVSVLSRSFGAVALEMAGAFTLVFSSWSKRRALAVTMLLIPFLYVGGRLGGDISGQVVAEAVSGLVDRERGASFAFRLENENVLLDKALERAVLGWGGWGRSRVYDDEGNDVTTTDSLWIIVLGDRGVFGLTALGLAILFPAAATLLRIPPACWTRADLAAPVVLAMTIILYGLDGLANAMVNPLFMLMAGSLISFTMSPAARALRWQKGQIMARKPQTLARPRKAPANGRPRAVVKYAAVNTTHGAIGDNGTCPAL